MFQPWLKLPASHLREPPQERHHRHRHGPLATSLTLAEAGGSGQPVSNLVQPVVAALRQLMATMYGILLLLVFGYLSSYNNTRQGRPGSTGASPCETTPHCGRRALALRKGRRFAYVTLLTKDAYLPGVQALYRSVRLVGCAHPFIVMYTKGVSHQAVNALRKEGCIMQFAEQFEPKGIDHSEYKRALYMECWNKLRMWEMTQYDRLVYLDADMILRRNMDHLFDLPQGFYAVGDCYGGRETAEERGSCCHHNTAQTPEYFNAGFYVMTPSLEERSRMEQALAQGRITVRFFAEQDFLNGYFKGNWKHLPYTYNAQKRIKLHHPDLWCLDDIYVIHYVDEKPWSHRYSEENMGYQDICDWWWAVYTGSAGSQHLPASIEAGHTAKVEDVPADECYMHTSVEVTACPC